MTDPLLPKKVSAGNQAILSKQMTDIFKQTQSAYDRIVLEFTKRNHASLDGNLLALAHY